MGKKTNSEERLLVSRDQNSYFRIRREANRRNRLLIRDYVTSIYSLLKLYHAKMMIHYLEGYEDLRLTKLHSDFKAWRERLVLACTVSKRICKRMLLQMGSTQPGNWIGACSFMREERVLPRNMFNIGGLDFLVLRLVCIMKHLCVYVCIYYINEIICLLLFLLFFQFMFTYWYVKYCITPETEHMWN